MYSEVLRNEIKRSQKTLDQIVKDCEKFGVKITKSYLSKLQNGKRNPPREEITFAIAKALEIEPWILFRVAIEDQLKVVKNHVNERGIAGNGKEPAERN